MKNTINPIVYGTFNKGELEKSIISLLNIESFKI